MKKSSFSNSLNITGILSITLALIVLFGAAKAQSLATWTMTKADQYKPTLVAANVTAGLFSADASFGASFSNTTGIRLKQGQPWPATPPSTTNTFNIDFPISPKAGFDATLTDITLQTPSTTITSGKSILLTPYFQVDGHGNWQPISTEQSVQLGTSTVTFTGMNLLMFSTHNYTIRLYLTSNNGATKNDYFSMFTTVFSGSITPAMAIPLVTTITASKSISAPKYVGTVTGSYSTGSNFRTVTQSGVCWTTNSTVPPDTSLATKTTDGSNGTINDNITGLSAGTTYYVRAYAVTQADVLYGSTVSFTTDAPTAPILTTVAASNIVNNKANSGGIIIDSGGVAITQEGVCWSTTQGAETATSGTSFTNDGTASVSFISTLKSLLPSTTYYVKAYAINSIGITYGNEISFTTTAPVPTILASTANLSFPTVVINAPSTVLSFYLTANYLQPASDSITITPPVGFAISTSNGGGFITAPSVLTLPYSNSALPATTIYVKQITTGYGLNTGNLLFSGGGASNPSIDTVSLSGSIIQDPNVLTNLGTDFWVGHGLEEHMENKSGYGLQLYIAAGAQSATIKVSVPGIPSFAPQYYTVAADSVVIVSGFPTGDPNDSKNGKGLPDCRLYYTGISDRGIHVEVTNNVPVALFLYDYATNNSAGGSMVFPTNTWNSSYIVQTYGGAASNTGVPNTYFFVIAKEDNTLITFKPTVPIIDSASSPVLNGNKPVGNIAYAANTTSGYQIILNKGQVFNALGLVDQGGIKGLGVSEDLTGTTVVSDCSHPISVFAGNSRTLITAPGLGCSPVSGSDNLIQQMFPKVAWGTKYLTVPTKTMEYNVFRIGVQDATTTVKVDDTPLDKATLNATGSFYEIEGNTCKKIESDKPINVTQFILPGGACGDSTVGNIGTGDPEMILLSPVQQSIKSTTVYTSDFKDGSSGGTYINVVIPTKGVSSFRLDSTSNPTQMVDTGTSSYHLDSITGTAYGAAPLIPIANAFTPFTKDSSYSWAKFHVSYPSVHTLSASVGFNAIAYGTAKGESWGYNAGTSIQDLTAIITANTPFGTSPYPITCKGNSTGINISLPYDPSKISSLQWVSANDPSVLPSNDTAIGNIVPTGSFVRDGITYYTFKSPKSYTFDSIGSYKFTVTAFGTFTNECGGSKTFDVVMNILRDTTNFSFTPITCGSATLQFKDQTKPIPGDTLSKWQWSFGTTTKDSSYVQNPTFTFPASATYQVRLRTINNIGCYTDTVKKVTVTILAPPVADFSMPASICIPTGKVQFINKSDTAVTGKQTYLWNFGDGAGTSLIKDPTYTYTVPKTTGYTVKLIATSSIGCKDTVTHVLSTETPPAHSTISSSASSNTILAGQTITLTDDIANGIWVNTDNTVASLDSLGNTAKVKGLTKGEDIILYINPSKVCKPDTASFTLEVIPSDVFIPNLFSPNGDSHNPVFYVRGSSAIYKEVHLWVFSSWGNLVFESKGEIDNKSYGWDGKYKGQDQPIGVYVYAAKLTKIDGTIITRNGSITLIR